jgi:hypothetical protein
MNIANVILKHFASLANFGKFGKFYTNLPPVFRSLGSDSSSSMLITAIGIDAFGKS